MNNIIKVAFLSSLTTAALVYVLLEWRPLQAERARAPEVSWAAPGTPLAEPEPVVAAVIGDDERNNIELYKKYSAAVVNITTTAMQYDFRLRPYPVEAGTGSGVIIDTDGYIVTNYHVIEPSLNGGDIEVTLADKSNLKARIVGRDPSTDLAVLKIDAPKNRLTAIPLGTSNDLEVGQKVLAIGNPYGYERTLTTGIISATGRSIEAGNGRIIENIIQTDAAINSGNSGGPLLNSVGEIIGINFLIVSPSNTGNIGIGFAIPADTVKRVVADLKSVGYVRRPYVGIEDVFPMEAYRPELADKLGIPPNQGFMVLEVTPGSPADRAGIRPATQRARVGNRFYPVGGDILVAFEGRNYTDAQVLLSAIDRHKAGERVTFTILRGSQKLDVPIVLQEARPAR